MKIYIIFAGVLAAVASAAPRINPIVNQVDGNSASEFLAKINDNWGSESHDECNCCNGECFNNGR